MIMRGWANGHHSGTCDAAVPPHPHDSSRARCIGLVQGTIVVVTCNGREGLLFKPGYERQFVS